MGRVVVPVLLLAKGPGDMDDPGLQGPGKVDSATLGASVLSALLFCNRLSITLRQCHPYITTVGTARVSWTWWRASSAQSIDHPNLGSESTQPAFESQDLLLFKVTEGCSAMNGSLHEMATKASPGSGPALSLCCQPQGLGRMILLQQAAINF